MKQDHVHVWIDSKTTHVGQVCKICGARPIVQLSPEPKEVDLENVLRTSAKGEK